jgi:hypothetical protein
LKVFGNPMPMETRQWLIKTQPSRTRLIFAMLIGSSRRQTALDLLSGCYRRGVTKWGKLTGTVHKSLRKKKSPDLVWILGGDRLVDSEEKREIWRSLGEGLRTGDSGTHLVTFHPQGGDDAVSTSAHAFPNSDGFLDFNMRQNGHGNSTKTWQRIADDYARMPAKPVLDGEPLYEDHPIEFDAPNKGYSNAHDIRRFLYLDLFAGACGHTYGHHSVWQFHSAVRGEGINRPLAYWREALDCPGAWQVRHARALLESRPFLSRIPDQELVVASSVPAAVPGTGARRIQSTRDADGRFAMIYSASSRAYVVRTESLRGRQLRLWWFNPKDGSHADRGLFDKRRYLQVSPPSIGEDIDYILIADDAAQGYPPPGSGRPAPAEDIGKISSTDKI